MFKNRMMKKNQKEIPFFNAFSFISVPRDVPGRDGTGCQNPVPSRGKILSLSQDKEGTSVPLSRKVALSRPVGNPTVNYVISFGNSKSKHSNEGSILNFAARKSSINYLRIVFWNNCMNILQLKQDKIEINLRCAEVWPFWVQ